MLKSGQSHLSEKRRSDMLRKDSLDQSVSIKSQVFAGQGGNRRPIIPEFEEELKKDESHSTLEAVKQTITDDNHISVSKMKSVPSQEGDALLREDWSSGFYDSAGKNPNFGGIMQMKTSEFEALAKTQLGSGAHSTKRQVHFAIESKLA